MKRTGEGLLQAERDRRLAERRQAGEKCIAGKDARMKLITLEFGAPRPTFQQKCRTVPPRIGSLTTS